MKVLAAFSFLAALAAGKRMQDSEKPYAGHQVVETSNPSEAFLAFLEEAGADIWEQTYSSVQFLASPAMLSEMQETFAGVETSVVVEDIQAVIDGEAARLNEQEASIASSLLSLDEAYFQDYKRYDESKAALQQFASQNSNLVTFIPSIGRTHEGRDIFALRITSGSGAGKKKIYFQGQQHAREWISNATVQYIMYQLVEQYGTNSQVTDLVDDLEWVFVPFVNPDGYEFSWDSQRLWRKNRRSNGGGSFGVDTNRNWDYNWASGGSSSSSRSDTYHGPRVESEPEVQAVSAFFEELAPIVAVDWHSFSQLILRPLGDTRANTIHEPQLREVTEEMRDIIRGVSGQVYTAQKGIDLYVTTGTAGDYFYVTQFPEGDRFYQPYGLTMELRPRNSFGGAGFILPPEQIIPTGEENFPAALALADYARNNILWADGADGGEPVDPVDPEPEPCSGICCIFPQFCQ